MQPGGKYYADAIALMVIIGAAVFFLIVVNTFVWGAELKVPTVRYDQGVTYDATKTTPAKKPSLRQCLAAHHYALKFCYGSR